MRIFYYSYDNIASSSSCHHYHHVIILFIIFTTPDPSQVVSNATRFTSPSDSKTVGYALLQRVREETQTNNFNFSSSLTSYVYCEGATPTCDLLCVRKQKNASSS